MTDTIQLTKRLCREGRLTVGTALAVLGLKALATLAEGFGVAMLVPVFELADERASGAAATDQERSAIWNAVARVVEALGLPMSVEVLLVAIVVMVILRQGLVYAHRVYLVAAQQRMVAALREEGIDACFAARLDYHDAHSTGAIVNDLAQETQRAVAVAFALISAAGNLILTGIYLIGMALAAGWVVLAVLLCTMFLAPAMRRLLKRTRTESEALASANRSFSDLVLERLRAVRLIKLSGAETESRGIVGDAIEQARRSTLELARMQAKIPLVVEPTGALLLAALFYGGVGILNLPFELVIVIILVIVRLIPVIQEIAKAAQVFLSGIGSMRFVVDRFRSAREAAEELSGATPMPAKRACGLRFQDVTYRYRQDDQRGPALKGLTAEFPAGCFSAIVGPSGAGKSTLIDLIPKLREAESGRILIDGEDVSTFDVKSLRDSIAFVPQTPRLLAGTIEKHITFGVPGLSRDDVEAAARLAGLHDYIASLPEGYDTPLGEDGVGLSGGQKQRLDLARAIARSAPIVILDEPASNLDPEAEAAFRDALGRVRRETEATVILIAHRFASIVDADVITVIRDGRAVDAGTHEELLGRCEWYRRAFAASDPRGERSADDASPSEPDAPIRSVALC
jgi:ABC-type multidrug transport system fused ATPase/permease subunit